MADTLFGAPINYVEQIDGMPNDPEIVFGRLGEFTATTRTAGSNSGLFDADYFLRGKQSGLSLYENYRWMPDLTIPFCRRIAQFCGIDEDDTIADFGCARGYVVRAFRELGFRAFGFDVSAWAIDNADPTVKNYVRLIEGDSFARLTKNFDWVVAKDVLEHIPDPELESVIDALVGHARKGVFVVVPLSPADNDAYVVPDYEKDVTHVQRLTLGSWVKRLNRKGFCVSACYLVPGIKQNYSQWEQGNGFLTLRREVQL